MEKSNSPCHCTAAHSLAVISDLHNLLHEKHSTHSGVESAVKLQPYTWKEIRLFLSSSFIDTHAERDALIKRIIPNLNRILFSKFIYIVPVDLRWGVLREESASCHAIQRTCLNQVDRCRLNVDEYPWFLGLRTDRYGWVQDELLESGEYVTPDRYTWVETLKEHNKQLSITSLECVHAALPLKITRPVSTVFFYRREIINPQDIEDDLRWVFDFEFVMKDVELNADVQNQYTRTEKAMTYKKDKDDLDRYLKGLSNVNYTTYKCHYVKGGAKITGNNGWKKFGIGYVSGLEEFEKTVEKDLYNAINKYFELPDTSDLPKHVLENMPYENAVKEKASMFVGRTALSQRIYEHCAANSVADSVMIVHGNPGCGKSSLLAAVSKKCLDELREQDDFVFVHTVDSCPGSNNLETMLRRMQVNLRKYRIHHGESDLSDQCPKSNSDLKHEHVHFLIDSAYAHPDKKFVILIDAVNQLNNWLSAWSMWWLPPNSYKTGETVPRPPGASQSGPPPPPTGASKSGPPPPPPGASRSGRPPPPPGSSRSGPPPCPPGSSRGGALPPPPGATRSGPPPPPPGAPKQQGVGGPRQPLGPLRAPPPNLRFIVSTLTVEKGVFENACKVCPNAFKVHVGEMSEEDGQEMVAKILARYNKKLTSDNNDAFLGNQMKSLIDKNLSPLYLTAAAHALRRFGIYENVSAYICSLPNTIPGLFEFLLDSWSNEYGEQLICHIACILCLSRDGVLENEINDILAYLEQERNFDYVWSFSRLYDSLSGFLAAGGGGFLRFFHDQLNKVVRNKYLDSALEMEVHSWLSDFYLHHIKKQLCDSPSLEPPSYYQHCLQQVIYHQLRTVSNKGKVDFAYSLRNIYFLRERIAHEQEDQLQHEYIDALRQTSDEEDKQALVDWSKFARLYSSHIKRYPEWTYNLAINQTPTSYVMTDTNKFSEPSSPIDGYPLYWMNPPVEDTVSTRFTYGCRVARASTPDKNLLCRAGWKHVLVYEADSSVLINQMTGTHEVSDLCLSTDGQYVWIGDDGGYLSIRNIYSGNEEWKSGQLSSVGCVSWIEQVNSGIACGITGFPVNGKWSMGDGYVYIHDRNKKLIIHWFTGSSCGSYCYQHDKGVILSAHNISEWQPVIKSWTEAGVLLSTLQLQEGRHIRSLCLHPQKEDIVAFVVMQHDEKESQCVRQVNIRTGEQICCLPGASQYSGVVYDATGSRIIYVSKSTTTIMVWGEDGAHLQNQLKGHSLVVKDISLVPGKNQVFTAAIDGSILFNLPSKPDTDDSNSQTIFHCYLLACTERFATFTGSLIEDPVLQVWTVDPCERTQSLKVESGRGITVCPSGQFIIVYTPLDLTWYNVKNLAQVSVFSVVAQGDQRTIAKVKISPDGSKFIVGRKNGIVNVLDIHDIYEIKHLTSVQTPGDVWCIDIHKDNELMVTGAAKGMDVWNCTVHMGPSFVNYALGGLDLFSFCTTPTAFCT